MSSSSLTPPYSGQEYSQRYSSTNTSADQPLSVQGKSYTQSTTNSSSSRQSAHPIPAIQSSSSQSSLPTRIPSIKSTTSHVYVMNNILINTLAPNSKCFVKFNYSIITRVSCNKQGKYYIGPHEGNSYIYYCAKAISQSCVNGNTLSKMEYSKAHYPALATLFRDIKILGEHGFTHNDAHSGNIMYDEYSCSHE